MVVGATAEATAAEEASKEEAVEERGPRQALLAGSRVEGALVVDEVAVTAAATATGR